MDRTVFGSLKLPFETPDEPATPLGSRSQTADHHPYHTPLGKDFTPRSILRVRSQHETPTRPADGQVNDISVTTESDWFDAQEPRPSQDVPASNLSSQALDDHPSRPNAQSTSSVVERTETETSIYTDARSYVSEAGLRHGDKSVTFDLSTPEPESGNESETIQRLDSPPTVKQAVFEPYGLESSKSASSQPSSVSFLPQAVSKISMMNQQIPQSKVLRGLGLPVKKPQPEVAQRPMTATERRCEQAKEKAQQLLEKKKHDLQMKDGERSRKAEEKRLEKLKEQEAAKRKAAERHQAAAEKRALEEANRKLNDKSTAILHTTTVKMHASKTLNPALPSESISVPHIESIAAGAKHTRQAHNPRPPRIGSNTIVDENGDLPEPPSDYSDEEDDEEDEEVSDEESEEPQTSAGHYSNNIIDATPKRKNNKKKNEPTWVQTPELMKLIMAHERTNPDDVFGDARPPLEDVFREGMKRKPTRARADSAFTGNDCLSEAEILAYNKNMGYK
ncbi:hypothetical protein DFJ77DRAFT_469364 [Powellomyces hirtus]|nr:hypothetical protein DFJ77DRAFT_469364 [Powellomyces hirtus]